MFLTNHKWIGLENFCLHQGRNFHISKFFALQVAIHQHKKKDEIPKFAKGGKVSGIALSDYESRRNKNMTGAQLKGYSGSVITQLENRVNQYAIDSDKLKQSGDKSGAKAVKETQKLFQDLKKQWKSLSDQQKKLVPVDWTKVLNHEDAEEALKSIYDIKDAYQELDATFKNYKFDESKELAKLAKEASLKAKGTSGATSIEHEKRAKILGTSGQLLEEVLNKGNKTQKSKALVYKQALIDPKATIQQLQKIQEEFRETMSEIEKGEYSVGFENLFSDFDKKIEGKMQGIKEMFGGTPVGMAAFAAGLVFVGQELSKFSTQIANAMQSIAKMNLSLGVLERTSKGAFGNTKVFQQFREQMVLTREQILRLSPAMVQFTIKGRKGLQTMNEIASNIKETFGTLDVEVFQKTMQAIKGLPQQQANALLGKSVSLQDQRNLYANMMNGGNLDAIIKAFQSGAFGELEGQSGLSEYDKQLLSTDKQIQVTLEDFKKEAVDALGSLKPLVGIASKYGVNLAATLAQTIISTMTLLKLFGLIGKSSGLGHIRVLDIGGGGRDQRIPGKVFGKGAKGMAKTAGSIAAVVGMNYLVNKLVDASSEKNLKKSKEYSEKSGNIIGNENHIKSYIETKKSEYKESSKIITNITSAIGSAIGAAIGGNVGLMAGGAIGKGIGVGLTVPLANSESFEQKAKYDYYAKHYGKENIQVDLNQTRARMWTDPMSSGTMPPAVVYKLKEGAKPLTDEGKLEEEIKKDRTNKYRSALELRTIDAILKQLQSGALTEFVDSNLQINKSQMEFLSKSGGTDDSYIQKQKENFALMNQSFQKQISVLNNLKKDVSTKNIDQTAKQAELMAINKQQIAIRTKFYQQLKANYEDITKLPSILTALAQGRLNAILQKRESETLSGTDQKRRERKERLVEDTTSALGQLENQRKEKQKNLEDARRVMNESSLEGLSKEVKQQVLNNGKFDPKKANQYIEKVYQENFGISDKNSQEYKEGLAQFNKNIADVQQSKIHSESLKKIKDKIKDKNGKLDQDDKMQLKMAIQSMLKSVQKDDNENPKYSAFQKTMLKHSSQMLEKGEIPISQLSTIQKMYQKRQYKAQESLKGNANNKQLANAMQLSSVVQVGERSEELVKTDVEFEEKKNQLMELLKTVDSVRASALQTPRQNYIQGSGEFSNIKGRSSIFAGALEGFNVQNETIKKQLQTIVGQANKTNVREAVAIAEKMFSGQNVSNEEIRRFQQLQSGFNENDKSSYQAIATGMRNAYSKINQSNSKRISQISGGQVYDLSKTFEGMSHSIKSQSLGSSMELAQRSLSSGDEFFEKQAQMQNEFYQLQMKNAREAFEKMRATLTDEKEIAILEQKYKQQTVAFALKRIDSIKNAAEKLRQVKMQPIQISEGLLSTKLDLARQIGAPFETILGLQGQLVEKERQKLKVQEQMLQYYIDTNAGAQIIAQQNLKVEQQRASLIKKQLGMQRSSIQQLMGGLIGGFTKVAGIVGPQVKAKIFGQGYMQNESGFALGGNAKTGLTGRKLQAQSGNGSYIGGFNVGGEAKRLYDGKQTINNPIQSNVTMSNMKSVVPLGQTGNNQSLRKLEEATPSNAGMSKVNQTQLVLDLRFNTQLFDRMLKKFVLDNSGKIVKEGLTNIKSTRD